MRTAKADVVQRFHSCYKRTLYFCASIALLGFVVVPAYSQQVYYSDVWEQFNEENGEVTIWGTGVTDDTPVHGSVHEARAGSTLFGPNGSVYQEGVGVGYASIFVTLPSGSVDGASYYAIGNHRTDAIVCNGLNEVTSSARLIQELHTWNYLGVGESFAYCDYERCAGQGSRCRFISVLKIRIPGSGCPDFIKATIKVYRTQPVVRTESCWPWGPFIPIDNCFQ